jgi:uncharacterized protein (TIGR00645 family)
MENNTNNETKYSKQLDPVGRFFNNYIEKHMWRTKFLVFIAVVTSIIVAIMLIFFGTLEAYHLIKHLSSASAQEIQLMTLGIVDMFLFGMVMMIFAFGSYNLFVSKIDNINRDPGTSEILPKWVRVENFDQLKTIFIKVVLMILIISFLQLVVTNAEKFKEDIYSILILPIGILLISISLKLLHSDTKSL